MLPSSPNTNTCEPVNVITFQRPRKRGAQPSNRNALKHGLYSARPPTPISAHLQACSIARLAFTPDPAVFDRLIHQTQQKLLDYLQSRPESENPRQYLAWQRPICRSVKLIEKLTLASARSRRRSQELAAAASHPLELIRWGFVHAGITRDAYNLPTCARDHVSTSVDARPSTFLTDEQWAVIEPLLPQAEITNLRSKIHPGRPETNPRRLLDAIFWKLAHHARWQDIPTSLPSLISPAPVLSGQNLGRGRGWAGLSPEVASGDLRACRRHASPAPLTCRRYYRRLFLSGRLYTLYKALYHHLLAHLDLDLPSLIHQGLLFTDGRQVLCLSPKPDTWQTRTLRLFLQLAYQNLRCLLKEMDQGHPHRSIPLLVHLPSSLSRAPACNPADEPSGLSAPNQKSLIQNPPSNHSFRANCDLSDFHSAYFPPRTHKSLRPCPSLHQQHLLRPIHHDSIFH
jgi:hypothetical protein